MGRPSQARSAAKNTLVVSNPAGGSSSCGACNAQPRGVGGMTGDDLWGAISEDRRRDGGRHPGFRERVALRGASRERWSRSVQRVGRVSSRFARRADDSGCPLVAEEGHVTSFERTSFTRSRDWSRRRASLTRSTPVLSSTFGQTRASGRNRRRCRGRWTSRALTSRKRVAALVHVRTRELEAHGPYVVFRCRSRQATPGLENPACPALKKGHRRGWTET